MITGIVPQENNNMINLKPIGYVQNDIPDDEVPRKRAEMVSEILIDEEWTDALLNIEEYSHIFVLFWMHKVGDIPVQQLTQPRGDKNLPTTGILATRSRNRPNPIGMAVAELLERDGNRLIVKRLDAFDGTPVLDLKPYDDYDAFDSIRVPEWWAKRCRK